MPKEKEICVFFANGAVFFGNFSLFRSHYAEKAGFISRNANLYNNMQIRAPHMRGKVLNRRLQKWE